MFLISYQTGQWQNSQNLQLQLDDSDSETKYRKTAEFEFSEPFHNKFTKKSEGERFQSLKIYREEHNMQLMAKAVFDFSMEDNDRFKLLFETGSNLKWMWQFIYLSFTNNILRSLTTSIHFKRRQVSLLKRTGP